MVRRSAALRLLFIVPAAAALTGASGYSVAPTKKMVLPPAQPVEAGQEVTLKPGDVLLRNPVGYSQAATLEEDVSIGIAGKSATLVKGSVLMVAMVGGEASTNLVRGASVFCTEAQTDSAKAFASLLTLGLAGNLRSVGMTTQFCLVDSEGDGKVDEAFLAGTKNAEDQKPVQLTPTAITVGRGVPMPGESEARIRYRGPVGITGNLGFDLEVVENGKPLSYNNRRSLVKKGQLPADMTIFRSKFTVLSYDAATKEARIRLASGIGVGTYGITTTYSTQYIPIYIPR